MLELSLNSAGEVVVNDLVMRALGSGPYEPARFPNGAVLSCGAWGWTITVDGHAFRLGMPAPGTEQTHAAAQRLLSTVDALREEFAAAARQRADAQKRADDEKAARETAGHRETLEPLQARTHEERNPRLRGLGLSHSESRRCRRRMHRDDLPRLRLGAADEFERAPRGDWPVVRGRRGGVGRGRGARHRDGALHRGTAPGVRAARARVEEVSRPPGNEPGSW